jgi:hypothetical protein
MYPVSGEPHRFLSAQVCIDTEEVFAVVDRFESVTLESADGHRVVGQAELPCEIDGTRSANTVGLSTTELAY